MRRKPHLGGGSRRIDMVVSVNADYMSAASWTLDGLGELRHSDVVVNLDPGVVRGLFNLPEGRTGCMGDDRDKDDAARKPPHF